MNDQQEADSDVGEVINEFWDVEYESVEIWNNKTGGPKGVIAVGTTQGLRRVIWGAYSGSESHKAAGVVAEIEAYIESKEVVSVRMQNYSPRFFDQFERRSIKALFEVKP